MRGTRDDAGVQRQRFRKVRRLEPRDQNVADRECGQGGDHQSRRQDQGRQPGFLRGDEGLGGHDPQRPVLVLDAQSPLDHAGRDRPGVSRIAEVASALVQDLGGEVVGRFTPHGGGEEIVDVEHTGQEAVELAALRYGQVDDECLISLFQVQGWRERGAAAFRRARERGATLGIEAHVQPDHGLVSGHRLGPAHAVTRVYPLERAQPRQLRDVIGGVFAPERVGVPPAASQRAAIRPSEATRSCTWLRSTDSILLTSLSACS